ncbi:hypothetical protein HDV01_001603 [Terramyces sp. JEL0728]|nr:hypothetical protein HDV01_001603 [Terramyces sp. JEL0728]
MSTMIPNEQLIVIAASLSINKALGPYDSCSDDSSDTSSPTSYSTIPEEQGHLTTFPKYDTAVTSEKYTMYRVTCRILKYNGVQEPAKNFLMRYSEIYKFHQKLVNCLLTWIKKFPSELADAPLFPKKEFFKRFDPDVIAHRVVQFNQILKFIVLHPTLVQSENVTKFLEL